MLDEQLLCALVAPGKGAYRVILLVPGQGRRQGVAAAHVVDRRRGKPQTLKHMAQSLAQGREQAVFWHFKLPPFRQIIAS